MILSFRTDIPGQTVQTQIRLLLIRVYTVCHSFCIVWTHYSMIEPHSSNFRVITTNILDVRIFRKFTVHHKNMVHLVWRTDALHHLFLVFCACIAVLDSACENRTLFQTLFVTHTDFIREKLDKMEGVSV